MLCFEDLKESPAYGHPIGCGSYAKKPILSTSGCTAVLNSGIKCFHPMHIQVHIHYSRQFAGLQKRNQAPSNISFKIQTGSNLRDIADIECLDISPDNGLHGHWVPLQSLEAKISTLFQEHVSTVVNVGIPKTVPTSVFCASDTSMAVRGHTGKSGNKLNKIIWIEA